MKKINLIPNTTINDYQLIVYEDVPKNCTTGFVGCVENASNKDLFIEIEIDNKYMFESKNLKCCFWANPDNYLHSEIIMTSSFFEEFRNKDFLKFVVWHEIGHFHTLHYFDTVFDTNGSAQKTRTEYLEKGEIMPEEKVADLFALYYTSKEYAVNFLKYMIKKRRENTAEPVEINTKAVRELCLRKRFLSEFDDSEENIKQAICDLCGIIEFDLI